MTVAAPAALAAATARVDEIRARLGALGASAPAVTANGTAFASTLSQALGTGGASDASSGLSSQLSSGLSSGLSTGLSTALTTALSAAGGATGSSASAAPTGAAAGEQAVALAKSYTGVPYLWGGTDPDKGLDCSGLVQLVFDRLGVELPRTSAQQAKVGEKVGSLAQARAGDLVFFGSPVHHVGVYAGDGMMVDAPRRGKTVGLHKVWDRVTAIRRVTPEAAQPTALAALSAGRAATAATAASATSATSATASALGGASVTLPGGASGSIDDLLTRLVRTAAGSPSGGTNGTGTNGTGTNAATPAAPAVTTTVNALVAAARGYGPGAPGGVMGSAGEHSVTVPAASGTAATSSTTTTSPTTSTSGTTAARATAATSGAGWRTQPYADLFEAAGRTHGVDPALLSAIAKAESGYRASARSHAGATGLMQIMPGTARELGVDPGRPAEAVDGAARLVARYLETYDGDVDKVLAAYNAGPGAVKKYGGVPPYSETRTYVRRVTGYWEDLR